MSLLRGASCGAAGPMRAATIPCARHTIRAAVHAASCARRGPAAPLPSPSPASPLAARSSRIRRRRRLAAPAAASSADDAPSALTAAPPPSADPILVSAVSSRETIASLIAERLARDVQEQEEDEDEEGGGDGDEGHGGNGGGGGGSGIMVWATGAAAQFVAVGALAEAQPLLQRLVPGRRLEAAARWASGTDFEPDDQKRRLRKLEVWARAVPHDEGEGVKEVGAAAGRKRGAAKKAKGSRRLSADRTRDRDELVEAIARQLGAGAGLGAGAAGAAGGAAAKGSQAAAAAPPSPTSLAAVAAAALAPPKPAAAKKKAASKKAADEPAGDKAAAAAAAASGTASSGGGIAEVEARGEQAVMRALKAVLFLQQQQQWQGQGQGQQHDGGGSPAAASAAGAAGAPSASASSPSPSILLLAPRVDMVADVAAERRGEPAREVPGIVLELRAISGGP